MTARQKVAGLVIDELQKTAVKGTALKRILALLLAGGAGAGLASSGVGEDALGQLGDLFKAPVRGDIIPGSDQLNQILTGIGLDSYPKPPHERTVGEDTKPWSPAWQGLAPNPSKPNKFPLDSDIMGKIRNLGQSAGTGAAGGLRGLLSNLGL